LNPENTGFSEFSVLEHKIFIFSHLQHNYIFLKACRATTQFFFNLYFSSKFKIAATHRNYLIDILKQEKHILKD